MESAATGALAVQAAVRFRPDLAMVDLSLPDMTGWDVVRALREEAGMERLRVLIVSANAHEYVPGSEAALHDGFLMKPVDLGVLLAALQQQLYLQWLDDGQGMLAQGRVELAPALRARLGPYLEDLWQLGEIGHVRGIEARLRELEDTEPAAATMVRALRRLLERFDMKGYMKMIGEWRENS